MPVVLLKSPDAVFVHITKTGGTSIVQGAWGGRMDARARGHFPDEWRDHFKFAFVRHPLDRLVSAWLMFTRGTVASPKKRRGRFLARLGIGDPERDLRGKHPDMPLGAFLKIVTDETVSYRYDDYGDATVPVDVRMRLHALPQTHPYNCLAHAEFLGRYETIREDFAKVADRLGGGLELAHFRRTRRDRDWMDYFDPDTLEAAVDYYREDFRELGYGLPAPARA